MKRKYQRIWLSVLAVMVVLAMTAGCGSNEGANGEGTGSIPSSTPTVADQGNQGTEGHEPVTITVWDQPSGDAIDKEMTEQLFKEFEEKYDYITVDHKTMTGDSRKQFVTAMAGGTGPDAFHGTPFPIAGDWIRQGFALDLTSYWDSYEDKDQYIPSSLEAATVDGKLYGIPNFMYVMGLSWNKKLFADAGLDPDTAPKDWDEFVEFAKKLTIPQKQQYGYALLGMEWADWYFEYYVWQAGGDLTAVNDDGTVRLRFADEPTVQALQYYKELKHKHKVVQKDVLQDWNKNNDDFKNERVAMILSPSSGMDVYVADGLDIGFAPLPAGPSGESPSQVGGAYWIINPQSSKAKQDAAWKYITFMMSKEVQNRRLQFQKDNGQFPNLLSVRQDVKPIEFTEGISQDLVDGVLKSAENTHVEYYLKERLTPYIVKAIQTVLTNENADPLIELQAAQNLAQKEVVDPYNQEINQ